MAEAAQDQEARARAEVEAEAEAEVDSSLRGLGRLERKGERLEVQHQSNSRLIDHLDQH